MTNSQRVRRIVTCQGSIQLVTALSVLRYREQQHNQNCIYENNLVIYDLYAPESQIDEFAAFIKKMAQKLTDWQSITYIKSEQINDIVNKLNSSSPANIFQMVRSLVGIESADEIYLSRNWQFSNQLFINVYQSAEKICYGDSIGLYFSSTSKAFFGTGNQPKENSLTLPKVIFKRLSWCKDKTSSIKEFVREKLELKTVLGTIDFDAGYFVLPDILDEVPPMPTIKLDKSFILDTFEKLGILADSNYITHFQEKITGLPVVVLLTSNLSEATRISFNNEIFAYREFLLSQKIEQNTVLVIKPHPRDNINKIEKLKHNLSDIFSKIVVLSEPEMFYIPFEIFFLKAFFSRDLKLKDNIRIFAVSSACISLKLLFSVPSVVGFGDEITTRLFNENFVDGRLAHEHALRAAVENLETKNGSTTTTGQN
ncbi:alpha-2,8-polysialyltransferase family protein [Aetokthonos hydrillicola Thurmond2011]|jgi:hypothetical protein|uniref:Alpha-2,8-polysialyltransferase family protein n=1 Tax=Aetokthonos hydrillicola Thurmond2011 TaxID=2712845 RepID=A0AAP5M4B2_9CYAN|nr:polysialyltransferase family glycosyltransferase [Aetokthonos hydrillicola]MBO3457607.1 hypothetical protein [Aetokthonos hydrillicola CCALA 1050]MBW4587885.1 alpha-2,8-polysialyltransferase family protein [Aetokthonos hydrillicola CCALA 1050]MDR9894711.1 alpha-2,8-polysialyltransferase family protein [Aetokthonos hydrillicola Thurmond2011]